MYLPTQLSATLTLLVNIFLSLVTKRLLDSFLDFYKGESRTAAGWLAALTMLVVLIHTFVIFIRLTAADYAYRLDKVPRAAALRVFSVIAAILFVVYIMADRFSAEISEYVLWSAGLTLLWVVFDLLAKNTLTIYYRRTGEASERDAVLQVVVPWMFCDTLLTAFMVAIWTSLHFHKISSTSTGELVFMIFVSLAYLVQHSLSASAPCMPVANGADVMESVLGEGKTQNDLSSLPAACTNTHDRSVRLVHIQAFVSVPLSDFWCLDS